MRINRREYAFEKEETEDQVKVGLWMCCLGCRHEYISVLAFPVEEYAEGSIHYALSMTHIVESWLEHECNPCTPLPSGLINSHIAQFSNHPGFY